LPVKKTKKEAKAMQNVETWAVCAVACARARKPTIGRFSKHCKRWAVQRK